MKPTIIVEGPTHMSILRALLPTELVAASHLMPNARRSTIVSVARTHLIRNRTPTAVMLDTKTLDPTIISETIQTTRYLMAAVAGDMSFDVIYCIPQVEAIFFEDTAPLQRIFPKFGNDFIPQFARTQPKEQLEVLLQQGGGPRTLSAFLDQVTATDVEKLRSTHPIEQVMAFIANNTNVAASKA
jgi:hypothetical protein